MTRPSIVRADTIDLQHQEAPSAQDHRHSWYNQAGIEHAAAPGAGANASDPAHAHTRHDDSHGHVHPLAPHQAETLREVAHEAAEELLRSPGLNGPANGHGPGHDHGTSSNSTTLKSNDPNAAVAAAMDAYRQHEQDNIVAHNGVESSDEEDLGDDHDLDLDDDMMDKISSSPSIEDEDIDFEFVYALHTFVATVEGQANATKGDTMVLLDDSNSYWWLVRVVKDSSIGYLPAEHIETPTERLARLNKHRNIDLSATMLGDQATKQKNAFKNLRKRRKTVAFAEPTYVDYSDIDYSSEEEDIEELFGKQAQSGQKDQAEGDEPRDDAAQVEPLRTSKAAQNGDNAHAAQEPATATIKPVSAAAKEDGDDGSDKDEDDTSSVEEILHEKTDGPSRSRNGTVRNTDSFFNDEETKKITLTPNLLRDDNASRPSTDSTAKDSLKGRSSLENKMERELVADKDKKKSKDKKPSAIRSFFSRKDKKKVDDDDESFGKRSMDIIADSRESEEHPEDATSPQDKPSRTPSKLQKHQPRMEPSPSNKAAAQRSTAELSSFLNASRNDVASVPPASMRLVDPETQEAREVPSGQQPPAREPQNRSSSANTHRTDKPGITKIMPRRSASTGADAKPQKTVKAKTRMELDESDVSELDEEDEAPNVQPMPQDGKGQAAAAQDGRTATPQESQAVAGRTGDSSAQASPSNASNPPALVPDTSSAEGRSPDASPSPEHMQAKDGGSATSSQREQWDDGKLRAFFDEGEHIRDLLAVVYDKSDVPPVDTDHPYAGSLFREQNAKLAEITTQLDNLLGDWLARKQRMRGSL